MRSKLLSMVIGAAAVSAAVLVSQVPGVAQAAPLAPLAPAAGTAIPTATGGSDTLFGLTLPTGANCPDTGTVGYRLHGFIAPISVDVASLTWTGAGAPVGSALARNLFDQGGTGVRNIFPVGAPVVGSISGIPGDIQLSAGGVFGPGTYAPGVYQIGVACAFDTAGVNRTEKFYASRITISTNATASGGGAQANYVIGEAPASPVLTGGAVTATTAALSFTHPNSTPASTYTVQVTPALPAGGTATVSGVVVGATSTTGNVTLSNASTNQAYSVTVTAANGVLPNAVSSAVSVTPTAASQPAITPTFTPGVGNGTVTIPAVSIGGARTAVPNSYTLTVSPTPTVAGNASFTIQFVAGPITQVVNGLTAGTVYTFSLAPTYATPNAGPTTTVTGSSNSAQVVQQRITVVRPVGQLILTQRCGVNGALPALAGTNAFPGFPGALTPVSNTPNQVGTTPDITPATLFPNGGVPADSVTPDPQFNNYPFPDPATYPTECGVSLGTAKIITGGTALDGQYFAADGFINEVTIADLRDTDSGWEVRGQMSNFTGTTASSNVVSGNYLGWTPYIQNFTAPIAGGYGGQIVTAGAQVLPGTGATAATTGQGLGSGRRLAQAAPNAGLGVAQMDARLRMLIPATAKNDTYVGILNFTVLDNGNGTAP